MAIRTGIAPDGGLFVSDELGTQQARQASAIKKQLNVPAENVIITSSQTGTGIDELKKRIAEACL